MKTITQLALAAQQQAAMGASAAHLHLASNAALGMGSPELARRMMDVNAKPRRQPVHAASGGLMSSDFKFVPPEKTDIKDTWRRFGWVPMQERQR